MITFFTTAKPFRGHTEIIQRNALESWKRQHPDADVILFGDDFGAAETARDLNIRHEPHVERNSFGTKRLDYLFTTARAIARHNVLCYVNCDIILMQDFRRAVSRVSDEHGEFLMVGRRWDLEVCEPLDFAHENWQSRLEAATRLRGRRRTPGVDRLFRVHSRSVWRERAAFGDRKSALGQLAGVEGSRSQGSSRGCVRAGGGRPPESRLRLPPAGNARRVAWRGG